MLCNLYWHELICIHVATVWIWKQSKQMKFESVYSQVTIYIYIYLINIFVENTLTISRKLRDAFNLLLLFHTHKLNYWTMLMYKKSLLTERQEASKFFHTNICIKFFLNRYILAAIELRLKQARQDFFLFLPHNIFLTGDYIDSNSSLQF